MRITFTACLCVLVLALLAFSARGFHWDWRKSEELTYDQSLRLAKITNAERGKLARVIENRIRSEMSDLGIEPDHELKNVALNARIKVVHLSKQNATQFIVQGTGVSMGCSPTGNCPFWVFQRSRGNYKLLCHEESVQTFTVEDSRSSGYKDIVVGMHESATNSVLTLLRYRDGKYHEVGCYEARWSVLKGNVVHKVEEPLITPCALNK